MEVKLIEGRYLACWYGRENFQTTNRIVFEIFNIETQDILKSVETSFCCYRNMIYLPGKLIIFTSENGYEVLDFTTRKKENTIALRNLNQCGLKFIEKFKPIDLGRNIFYKYGKEDFYENILKALKYVGYFLNFIL